MTHALSVGALIDHSFSYPRFHGGGRTPEDLARRPDQATVKLEPSNPRLTPSPHVLIAQQFTHASQPASFDPSSDQVVLQHLSAPEAISQRPIVSQGLTVSFRCFPTGEVVKPNHPCYRR
jgi:hypothetical protein